MPKASGMGQALWVSGYDLSGDAQSYTINGGPGTLDVTGIDKSAYERIGGLREGKLEWTSFFNPSASQEHVALSPLPTADVPVILATATAIGSPAAGIIAKQLNYDPNRASDGALTIKLSLESNAFGMEWGNLATPGKRTESAAANGAGIDLNTLYNSGVSAAGFGLQAYIEVFALASGSPTVKLQGSSDNAVGDPYADIVGGTFGVVAANTGARIATAANLTIERYLRVVTTGTFSGLTFAVIVVPNVVSTVF